MCEGQPKFKLNNALLVDKLGEITAGLVAAYGPVVKEPGSKKVRVYQKHKVTVPGSSNWVKFSKIYIKYGAELVDSGL